MTKQTGLIVDRMSELAEAILGGPEEDLKPLAETALNLAAEAGAEMQTALESSRRALEAARAEVQAIGVSMTIAVYPPPYSGARMHAQTASALLQRVVGKDVSVTRTLEGKDREAATEAWRAAHAAEAAVKDLLDAVHGWKGKIASYKRYIAGARAQATACFGRGTGGADTACGPDGHRGSLGLNGNATRKAEGPSGGQGSVMVDYKSSARTRAKRLRTAITGTFRDSRRKPRSSSP